MFLPFEVVSYVCVDGRHTLYEYLHIRVGLSCVSA